MKWVLDNGQRGWSPIHSEGLYFHAMSTNKISESVWSTIIILNIASPLLSSWKSWQSGDVKLKLHCKIWTYWNERSAQVHSLSMSIYFVMIVCTYGECVGSSSTILTNEQTLGLWRLTSTIVRLSWGNVTHDRLTNPWWYDTSDRQQRQNKLVY